MNRDRSGVINNWNGNYLTNTFNGDALAEIIWNRIAPYVITGTVLLFSIYSVVLYINDLTTLPTTIIAVIMSVFVGVLVGALLTSFITLTVAVFVGTILFWIDLF